MLAKYSEPLAAAAMDLQSRCYNIVRLGFFEKFDREHDRYSAAQKTTLFRFAQYFGWTEILRRDIQYLSFPENVDTKCVAQLQGDIARRIASSDHDEVLMIWTDEQRAIGERMIIHEDDKSFCMGYARFCDDYDKCFAQLFVRVLPHLDDRAAHARLRETQVLLCKLVSALDKDELRYKKEHLKLASTP